MLTYDKKSYKNDYARRRRSQSKLTALWLAQKSLAEKNPAKKVDQPPCTSFRAK